MACSTAAGVEATALLSPRPAPCPVAGRRVAQFCRTRHRSLRHAATNMSSEPDFCSLVLGRLRNVPARRVQPAPTRLMGLVSRATKQRFPPAKDDKGYCSIYTYYFRSLFVSKSTCPTAEQRNNRWGFFFFVKSYGDGDGISNLQLEDLVGMIQSTEKNILLLNQARVQALEHADKILKEKEALQRKINILETKLSEADAQHKLSTEGNFSDSQLVLEFDVLKEENILLKEDIEFLKTKLIEVAEIEESIQIGERACSFRCFP
ncbi:hypothetical protein ACQ4PT_059359 [Festuca glaucescens]